MTDATLDTLARAEPAALKAFAEELIPQLGDIEVQRNRTGLVMLPMRDTAQGTNFHLGEVLVSEAQIAASGRVGYGMVRGHDLEQAMAMALVDLALATDVETDAFAAFVKSQADALAAADETRLRKIEATRVNMETF
ncbi:MAG: phosphonate C-P lyase system protein PhnG [Pseudomonadota bacterium]